jgi:small-conductance mechanosensitive channel
VLPEFVEGSPLWESLWAAGAFLIYILAAWCVYLVMRYVERKQEDRRKAKLLPTLLSSLHKPVILLIITQGIIWALATPSYLDSWRPVLQDISIGVAIVISAYGLGKAAAAVIEWYMRSRVVRRKARIDEGLIRFVRRILLIVFYILGALILLAYFNIDINPIIAGLGIGGLAVALALQPTLANFFAGTQIIADRVVRVGDYIELNDGTRGYVTDVGWRSTRIRTPYNNRVIIPNSSLAASIITNYYWPTMDIGVIVYCGVSYDSDLTKVQTVALDVARKVVEELDEAVKDFEPWFAFEQFGDSNIDFWVWIQAKDRLASFRLKSELIRQLHARFEQEGITINYPVRRIVYDEYNPPLLPGSPQ